MYEVLVLMDPSFRSFLGKMFTYYSITIFRNQYLIFFSFSFCSASNKNTFYPGVVTCDTSVLDRTVKTKHSNLKETPPYIQPEF